MSPARRGKRNAVWGAVLAGTLAVGFASSAHATTPSPPPGAPAVESAPSSLTGLSPELPGSVITASAAPRSTWTPESAVYGTASINDIAVPGADGTTDPGQRDLPDFGLRRTRSGQVPGADDHDPLRQGPGRLVRSRICISPRGWFADGRSRQLPGAARLHRGGDGCPRHRRLQRAVGAVRSDPAAGRHQGPRLGGAPAQLDRVGGHLRPVIPGHRPAPASGCGGQGIPAQGHLPARLGQRPLPRHVLHGRAARLRVLRDLPGPDRWTEHGQPDRGHRHRSPVARRPGGDRRRPPQRAGQLPRRHHARYPQRGRRGLRRHLLAAAQPVRTSWPRSSPTASPPTCSVASSTSSRTASHSTTPLCRTPTTTVRRAPRCCPVSP